jgi:hypothetical protein
MSIPTANRICHFDLSNPACFSGSGLTINDLTIANNDYTFTNTNYTFTTTTGGEVRIDNTNLLSRAALNSYSYGTNPLTIVMWMQLNIAGGSDLSMFQAVNDTGGVGSYNTLFWGTNTSSRNLFVSTSGGEFSTSETINLNEWYMLAVTFPSGGNSGNIKLYKNGNLVSGSYTGVGTVTLPGSTPTFIDSVVANLGVWSCDMTVGMFSLYNTELSSTAIQDYYDATSSRFIPLVETFKIDAADPACYSGSGTTVYDLSAAARVGNLDTVSGGSSTWSPSYGGIFTLDGFNDIFEFPGGGVAVSQPGSISVWFRSDDAFNGGNVVSQGSYGDNGWGLNLSGAFGANYNTLHLVSHGVGYRNTGVGVTVGEWVFATLNYNNDSTSSLFINGGLGATMSAIGINPPQQLIRIGYDGGGVDTPQIDVAQVYMYGQAITLQDHIDLYNATKTPFVPAPPIPIQNSNVGGRSFNKGLNG